MEKAQKEVQGLQEQFDSLAAEIIKLSNQIFSHASMALGSKLSTGNQNEYVKALSSMEGAVPALWHMLTEPKMKDALIKTSFYSGGHTESEEIYEWQDVRPYTNSYRTEHSRVHTGTRSWYVNDSHGVINIAEPKTVQSLCKTLLDDSNIAISMMAKAILDMFERKNTLTVQKQEVEQQLVKAKNLLKDYTEIARLESEQEKLKTLRAKVDANTVLSQS